MKLPNQILNQTLLISIFKIVAAVIMLQTLYYKFSASAESVYIFTSIGMEPWGRFTIGILELCASAALFIPIIRWLGAALGANLMLGALYFHATTLGFEVMNDHGQLVLYACAVLVCCIGILILDRQHLLSFIQTFRSKL